MTIKERILHSESIEDNRGNITHKGVIDSEESSEEDKENPIKDDQSVHTTTTRNLRSNNKDLQQHGSKFRTI
jgi:hypothetical protein